MLKLNKENSKYTCQYCKWWIHSKVIKRETVEEDEGKKKRKKTKLIKRKCPTKNRKAKPIENNSPACKYFNPNTFWCDSFESPLSLDLIVWIFHPDGA